MFRTLLAIGAVVFAFGATLVIGGDKLGAWDSPQAAPAPKTAAGNRAEPARKKPAARRRARARRPVRRAPSWVAELDALCRSAEAAVAAQPQPQTPAEVLQYVRRAAGMSAHWNRRAARPLARAARRHPAAVQRLRELFAEERRLFRAVVAAAERNDIEAFARLGPDMVANGVEQSHVLVALGADDCSLPADVTL